MKGITFNTDGIKIKENMDLYHDRVERLIYMSGVLGRPDWTTPINDTFFKNTVTIDDMDDLINDIIILLEDEPDLDISAITGQTTVITQEQTGLSLRFDFNQDKNTAIENNNLIDGFTFFSIYEA